MFDHFVELVLKELTEQSDPELGKPVTNRNTKESYNSDQTDCDQPILVQCHFSIPPEGV